MGKIIEVVRYGFFGAITTAINLILFMLLEYVGMHYLLANTLAYFIAVLINFVFNKKFVFKEEVSSLTHTKNQLIKFVIVRGISLGIDNVLFYCLIDILGFNLYISRVSLSMGIILMTFIISKLFIFKKEEKII